MWLRHPRLAADIAKSSHVDAKVERQLWLRGTHVHMPVLNLVETFFARKPLQQASSESVLASVVHATEMHSPAQPLPEANTATIRDRWFRWIAQTARVSGSNIDPA